MPFSIGAKLRKNLSLKNALRALGSLAALTLGVALFIALVLWMNNSSFEIKSAFQNFSFPAFLGVLLCTYFLMTTGAQKWAVLSESLHGAAGREPQKNFFLRHYLWQNWIGQFVPPSLAIILGRGFASRGMTDIKARAGVASGIWDQAMEFALLVGMMPAAAAVIWMKAGAGGFFLLSFSGMAVAYAALYSASLFLQKKLFTNFPRLMALSAIRVFLTIIRLVLGSMALGLSLNPLLIVAAVPIVSMVSLIPLTPGNLGIAEWGWVGVMALGGVDPVLVAFYAVGFRVMVLIAQTLLLGAFELKKRLLTK